MNRLMLALTVAAASLMGAKPEDTGFLDKTIDVNGTAIKYVVFVPKGYSADKPHPTILFLHGSGEQGDDGKKQAEVGLGNAIRKAEDKWNYIVVFPQKPKARGGWMDYEKLILDIMEKTKKEYKVDEKCYYITGLSMGGMATWALTCKYPDMWAAAAPICGRGNPAEAGKIKDLPIWNFHGDKDNAVPIKGSEEMIEAIKAAGGKPKFTIYPGVGHNSWDKAYQEETLYTWFLEHTKK
ncbi:MAG TPA: prolyl oligopeptidase family serine peptidase [Planctomycetota bacterium]|nr:prolyl oligopeptidase family serine peptidase [Planctomycetota bacterium]